MFGVESDKMPENTLNSKIQMDKSFLWDFLGRFPTSYNEHFLLD